tara:strand:- start:1092 stop:1475 length:384 start_codon:yes stop_codon:yes gene_type:complete
MKLRLFCLVFAVVLCSAVPVAGQALGAPAWLSISLYILGVVSVFVADWLVYEAEETAPRWCDRCGVGMFEGYCLGDGEEYYCGKRCLYQDGFTTIKFEELWNNNAIYYTSWDGEPVEDWHENPRKEL